MKTLILFLLLSFSSFAQIATDVHFPIKTNVVTIDNELIAQSEIYTDYAEIVFYEKGLRAHLFFFLTTAEFQQVGDILTDYTVQDQDVLTLKMFYGGTLFIRFNKRNGYVASAVYVAITNVRYEFPVLNRLQYRRLFEPSK